MWIETRTPELPKNEVRKPSPCGLQNYIPQNTTCGVAKQSPYNAPDWIPTRAAHNQNSGREFSLNGEASLTRMIPPLPAESANKSERKVFSIIEKATSSENWYCLH